MCKGLDLPFYRSSITFVAQEQMHGGSTVLAAKKGANYECGQGLNWPKIKLCLYMQEPFTLTYATKYIPKQICGLPWWLR